MKRILMTSAALLLSTSFAVFAQSSSHEGLSQSVTTPAAAAEPTTPAGAMNRGATTTPSANSAAMNRTDANRAAANTAPAADSGAMFTSVSAKEELSSKVIGLEVYNNANQDVGKIKDIAFDQGGVKAYIVAVGGFLGMGDHYVAVQPAAVHLSWDANAKTWHAAMNTDADQLKAAPEYKYSSNE